MTVFSLFILADGCCSGMLACDRMIKKGSDQASRQLFREAADVFLGLFKETSLHSGIVYFPDAFAARGVRQVLGRPSMSDMRVARYLAGHTRRLYLAAGGYEVGERRLVATRDFQVEYHKQLAAEIDLRSRHSYRP